MAKPFILGIEEAIGGSAFLSSQELYDRVGHNTGNLAFHHAVSNILGGKLPAASWYGAADAINAAGDIGVMPCANQLGPHADYGSVAERFAQLEVKLVAIGLGAQGDANLVAMPVVPEGTLNWLREIVKRAPGAGPNISVRGEYTRTVMEHYGFGENAVVLGCPTLFLNPDPNLGEKIAENAKRPFARISVAAGHYKWNHLARLEASMTRIMAATGGSYIMQSPYEMVVLGRGEADELSDVIIAQNRSFSAPELTIAEFRKWSRHYSRSFFDISAWMEYLRACDFVVGLRIHGVMLALQAGIPALCIAHDSRTREMCETMKVPYVMAKEVVNGIKREDLKRLFVFDAEEFDENRRNLATKFQTFLSDNDLKGQVLKS